MKSNKGFSLVELIVVIAIMAIIAAVAIPVYSSYITEAEIKTAKAEAQEFAHSVELDYYVNGGTAEVKTVEYKVTDGVLSVTLKDASGTVLNAGKDTTSTGYPNGISDITDTAAEAIEELNTTAPAATPAE